MSDLVNYIIRQLVNHPDDVSVQEQRDGSSVDVMVSVNPEDMGLVIGKNGQTIRAIRKILITKAMAENVKVSLQLTEPGA